MDNIEISGRTIRSRGYSLLELTIAVSIVAIIAAVALPAFQNVADDSNASKSIMDIQQIQVEIKRFHLLNNGDYPASLADIGWTKKDPWGNAYVYLSFAGLEGSGQKRKDKEAAPVNTDYDLFSKGDDGASSGSLTASNSLDDVIRASNGDFVGSVKDY